MMKTVSLKLPRHLDRKLTALSQSRRKTRSAIVRDALESFAAEPAESVTALAADLVGSLSGPKDLSATDRHMADYGR